MSSLLPYQYLPDSNGYDDSTHLDKSDHQIINIDDADLKTSTEQLTVDLTISKSSNETEVAFKSYLTLLSKFGKEVVYQVAVFTAICLICGNPLVPAEIASLLLVNFFFGLTQSTATSCIEASLKNKVPSFFIEVFNFTAFAYVTSRNLEKPALIITQKFISFLGAKIFVKGAERALECTTINKESELRLLIKIGAGVAGSLVAGWASGHAIRHYTSGKPSLEDSSKTHFPKRNLMDSESSSVNEGLSSTVTPSSTSSEYNTQYLTQTTKIALEQQTSTSSQETFLPQTPEASSGQTSATTKPNEPKPTPFSTHHKVATQTPTQTSHELPVLCDKGNATLESVAGDPVLIIDINELSDIEQFKGKAFYIDNDIKTCRLVFRFTSSEACAQTTIGVGEASSATGEAPEVRQVDEQYKLTLEIETQVVDCNGRKAVRLLEDVMLEEDCRTLEQLGGQDGVTDICTYREVRPSLTYDLGDSTLFDYLQSNIDQTLEISDVTVISTFIDMLKSKADTVSHTPTESMLSTVLTPSSNYFNLIIGGTVAGVIVIKISLIGCIIFCVCNPICRNGKKHSQESPESVYAEVRTEQAASIIQWVRKSSRPSEVRECEDVEYDEPNLVISNAVQSNNNLPVNTKSRQPAGWGCLETINVDTRCEENMRMFGNRRISTDKGIPGRFDKKISSASLAVSTSQGTNSSEVNEPQTGTESDHLEITSTPRDITSPQITTQAVKQLQLQRDPHTTGAFTLQRSLASVTSLSNTFSNDGMNQIVLANLNAEHSDSEAHDTSTQLPPADATSVVKTASSSSYSDASIPHKRANEPKKTFTMTKNLSYSSVSKKNTPSRVRLPSSTSSDDTECESSFTESTDWKCRKEGISQQFEITKRRKEEISQQFQITRELYYAKQESISQQPPSSPQDSLQFAVEGDQLPSLPEAKTDVHDSIPEDYLKPQRGKSPVNDNHHILADNPLYATNQQASSELNEVAQDMSEAQGVLAQPELLNDSTSQLSQADPEHLISTSRQLLTSSAKSRTVNNPTYTTAQDALSEQGEEMHHKLPLPRQYSTSSRQLSQFDSGDSVSTSGQHSDSSSVNLTGSEQELPKDVETQSEAKQAQNDTYSTLNHARSIAAKIEESCSHSAEDDQYNVAFARDRKLMFQKPTVKRKA